MQETQETQVESLGQGDALEGEMAIHSSILACLENPMDGGAWWATVHRVTKSRTRLVNWALLHISACCLTYILHLNLFFSIEIWEVCTESLVCLILSVLKSTWIHFSLIIDENSKTVPIIIHTPWFRWYIYHAFLVSNYPSYYSFADINLRFWV